MLQQFKLEGYIPDGDSMKVESVVYADTPEEVYRYYTQMVGEKDKEGNKKYVSTRLHVGAYKLIKDPTGFFNIFKAQ